MDPGEPSPPMQRERAVDRMDRKFLLWVGVDWGGESHQVCVLDAERKVLVELSVPHTGKAIAALAERLLALAEGDASRLAVAIETPRGSISETLLDRDVAVFSINPKQLDRFRDRHTVAGAKDDRRDAFVLADSLRIEHRASRSDVVSQSGCATLRGDVPL